MQISAKELRHLASDVDDMHHEAMRTFTEEAAELHLTPPRGPPLVPQEGRPRRRRRHPARHRRRARDLHPPRRPGRRPGAHRHGDRRLRPEHRAGRRGRLRGRRAQAVRRRPRRGRRCSPGHHQDHADAFGAVAGDDARPRPTPSWSRPSPRPSRPSRAAEPSDELTGQILGFAKGVENQAAYTYAAALTAAAGPGLRRRHLHDPARSRPSTPPCCRLALGEGPDDVVPDRRLRVRRRSATAPTR